MVTLLLTFIPIIHKSLISDTIQEVTIPHYHHWMNLFLAVHYYVGKSDHAVLSFCCDVKTVSASHAPSYDYQKEKYDELQNSLDIDLDQALCAEDYSVDEMWHLLKNKLLNGIDKYIPRTGNRPPNKRHAVQPFSNDIKQLINRKHRLWIRYMETRELTVLTEYKNSTQLSEQ